MFGRLSHASTARQAQRSDPPSRRGQEKAEAQLALSRRVSDESERNGHDHLPSLLPGRAPLLEGYGMSWHSDHSPTATKSACKVPPMPNQEPPGFSLLESQAAPFYVGNRTRSTALLAWFLQTVLREDPDEVEDAICDGSNDKGVDAILFDEDANEFIVLQAKHRQNPAATQGDADLKAFLGVAPYFQDEQGIDSLLASAPNEELLALLERLDVKERITDSNPSVRLVFVTNALADASAISYIETVQGASPQLDVWDRTRLAEVALRTERPQLLPGKHVFGSIDDVLVSDFAGAAKIGIALIPAVELVRLPGIENLTIFALNVRLGLGNTKINRELRATIRTAEEHELFPAYHNGLTILTAGLRPVDEGLELDGLAVVNGCQSLLSLWQERNSLTPELKLVVKIIELGEQTELADQITYRSNNQNPVNIRDQRSNDRIQRDLQAEVSQRYPGVLFYDIRRGQSPDGGADLLDNQLAAQLLMAIWLDEPWNAVRKVRLFDQDYHRIFRHATADRLFLAYLINSEIVAAREKLQPRLQTAFASVRFTLADLVAQLLRQNEAGSAPLEDPGNWLPEKIDEVRERLSYYAEFVIDETNYFVKSQEEARQADPTLPPFDPKTTFKSAAGVRALEQQVIQSVKAIARRPEIEMLFAVPPK